MDIQHLKYFIEIAKNKNYTRAAEKLFITQPMLTRTMKQIEDELGVKLIERSSRSFKLTDAGEAFYEHASDLLLHHQDIFRAMEDIKNVTTGEIHMSTPGVLLDMYFPPLLNDFFKEHPHINISIIEEGSSLTAQAVLTDKVDLGLVMLPVKGANQLETTIVTSNECCILVEKNHPFAKQADVSFPQLAKERIITFSETATLHDSFLSMCEGHGVVPNIAYKSLMPSFIFDMVAYGNCVAVLPYPVICRYITPNLKAVPLRTPMIWDIALIHKKNRYQSFATKKFTEFLMDYFQKQQNSFLPR